MTYIYELESLLSVDSIGMIFELLMLTTCISTILFFLTKNQNISLLSSVPIFYLISTLQQSTTHLFFLIIALLVQGIILLMIEQQSKKKLSTYKQEVKEIQTDWIRGLFIFLSVSLGLYIILALFCQRNCEYI